MSDLLPTSTNSHPPHVRASPSPSPLGAAQDTSSPYGMPLSNSAASSSTTSLSSLISQVNSSLTDLHSNPGESYTSTSHGHSRSLSREGLVYVPSVTNATGPTIRPLDLAPLTQSHDATHLELARTVEELGQWLSLVEVGLTTMLGTKRGQETITIEEEQEQEEMVLPYNDVYVNGNTDRHEPLAEVRTNSPSPVVALVALEES